MPSLKAKIIKNAVKWGCILPLILITVWFFTSLKKTVLPPSYRGKDVGVILSAMPEKDRENLEIFFRELIEQNPFGYVLLGSKPMAFETFIQNINPLIHVWRKDDKEVNQGNECQPTLFHKFLFYCDVALSAKRFKLLKGYNTWRKYENFFPSEKFTFLYQNKPLLGANYLNIMLVNKELFTKTVNQNLDDFKEVLKCEISGETLLNELIQCQNVEPIIAHNGLFGTLLGYGRDNAFLYHTECHLKTGHEKSLFREKNHFGPLWDQEEYPFSRESTNGLCSIELPCFIANTMSIETKTLKQAYLAQRTKLIDYYKDKNFLEATLRLLTSDTKN